MRFLLDENLSPSICPRLIEADHAAIHVRDRGMTGAEDRAVLALARVEQRALITADRSDFGRLLRADQATAPSVVLLRLSTVVLGRDIADLLLANLVGPVTAALADGAFVVVTAGPIRIRPLPLR